MCLETHIPCWLTCIAILLIADGLVTPWSSWCSASGQEDNSRVNPLPHIYGCQYSSCLPLSHQNVLVKLASLGGQSSVLSMVEFFQQKVFEMAHLSKWCQPTAFPVLWNQHFQLLLPFKGQNLEIRTYIQILP